MKIIKPFNFLCFVIVVCLISPVASASSEQKFSISFFKGIIKPVGSMLPDNILVAPYSGAAEIKTTLPEPLPGELISEYPLKRFHFENELDSPNSASELGLEIGILSTKTGRLFLGISRSEFETNTDPASITFPIRGQPDNQASYHRKIAVNNQHITLGFEKKLKFIPNHFDVSMRSALQLIKSDLRDRYFFDFNTGFIEGKKRYDQYALNIPASYAMELGFNGIYHISKLVNFEFYAGYLLDISKSEYQIGAHTDNYSALDGIEIPSQIWNENIDGKANVLATDGETYARAPTNFSSWQLRVKLGVNF